MTIMAAIRAITESGQTYDDPDEETLYDLLSELNLRYRFLIVERPDSPQHYIQVRLEDDGSCLVEYRDGGPHAHYQARIPAPYAFHGHDTAAGIVNSWAHDDDQWRTALPWTFLTT
ncbi:hypothetical protein ACIBAG_05590 [Streptomyces sp. NPDC051243]|uniref:hypothetical protein n=1 Tax=Streptomyces sp. NPDC051243 TaxID=3365646 RepID=UPI00379EBCEF